MKKSSHPVTSLHYSSAPRGPVYRLICAGFLFLFFATVHQTLLAGPEDPWEGGQWGPVLDWPHIAVSAANLPDGRVMTWSGSEREIWPTTEQTYSATWDPVTGNIQEIFHPSHNMFCAHLAMMEDGRVFVNGGRNQINSPWVSIFDYRTDQWVQLENMATGGRWYPTTLALADGDIFTAIGTATNQRYPERWDPDSGWQVKNGIDFNAMVLDDYFSSGSHGESRWWPLLHLAPNGQIFHSGPTPKMHYIDPENNGNYENIGPEITAWYPKHGTTIMYDEGKILTAGGWTNGGNIASTNLAFTIDINGAAPILQNTSSMKYARKFHNGIALPDGKVLVVGGNTSGRKFNDSGSILNVETWDPATGLWTEGAAMTTPRNYHSIALLLTDGRVLAAGGGYCSNNVTCNGASHKDAEVYSPPYLFNGDGTPAARPSIFSGPDKIKSGDIFRIEASPGIQQFSMIKMASTTHGMNTDVRFVNVSFTDLGGGFYDLTAHANQNVLSPGYWMIFALDAAGVPSVAHVVQANSSGLPWIAQPIDQSTMAGTAANIQIVAGDADDDVLVFSASGLPNRLAIDAATGVISGTPTATGSYSVTVTANDNDEGSRSKSFQWLVFGEGNGSITREWWTGISGGTIASLTASANYPDQPSGSDFLTSFEAPVNWADNYGTRVSGFLSPPVSGEYIFWISGDDNSELWLSSNLDPSNLTRIAHVPGWSASRQWDKYPEQRSAVITLEAGQKYSIQALHKEGGGGDNLAVAWQKPGESTREVIPGAYLSPQRTISNIALGKAASQSSLYAAGMEASQAVDGDLAAGSINHTNNDVNAWWELDLGASYTIDSLSIWNRSDCCATRLTNFHVLISDIPFASKDLNVTQNQAGVSDFHFAGTAGAPSNFPINRTGRYVRVQLAGQNFLHMTEVQVFGELNQSAVAKVVTGSVDNVGSEWQTVTLSRTFNDMVVIATPAYGNSQLPAVTRIRNAAGNQFEIKVQNPSDAVLSGYRVHYMVVESGAYTVNGKAFEAVKYTSTRTDDNNSWVGEQRGTIHQYTNPVVVGQVMSANDPDWSVFWSHNGSRTSPATASALFVGKNVGEDPDATRANETVGYLVVEAGNLSVDGVEIQAATGADTVAGPDNSPPYNYGIAAGASFVVASAAGMDGNNGGWPVLWGTSPVTASTLSLAFDEDQLADSERSHTTEQIAYLALSQSTDPVLTVDPVVSPPSVSANNVNYSAQATGPGTLVYKWSFGDGSPETAYSTDPNISHQFTTPGRYVVILTVRDENGVEVQQTFTQLIHAPLNPQPATASSSILLAADGLVWNVNPDNDSVSALDPVMQAVIAEISVGDEPRSLAQAPGGRIWVVNSGDASISMIDPVNRNVVQSIPLPPASRPRAILFDSSSALVTLENRGELLRLDAISGAELNRISLGDRPRHLSLSADQQKIYVSRFITPPLPGESTANVTVADTDNFYGGEVLLLENASFSVMKTIVLRHSDRLVSEHSGPGIPNYLGPVAISPDGLAAYVPSKQDNILAGGLRGGQGLTFDQTVRAVSSFIDLQAEDEIFSARIDHDNASVASHAVFGPYGIHLFTSLEGNREIAVSDAFTATEILRFDVGRAPQGLALSADGNQLYVHNFMDRTVGIYDVAAIVQGHGVSATRLAVISTVANEALASDALVGKQLFYDARDPRLAEQSYMSCASCHNNGDDDGRVWDFSDMGEGLRNTITLQGRAGAAQGFLHWSANFDEIQDFEGQIRSFAGGLGLMSDAEFNFGTRSEPLGTPKAGVSADLDALAAYLTSLDRVPASPFRDASGDLTAEAELGKQVFLANGCVTCHALPALTDSSDASGLHDIGTLTLNSGNRLGGLLNGIDTPSLLGVWLTPPYLHDGSAADLDTAISAHAGILLSSAERTQLVAFLSQVESGSELVDNSPKLFSGIVTGVGSSWQIITLAQTYSDMVVIATAQYSASDLPAVTRIRNASGNQFELKVQNPSDTPLSGYTVRYIAIEAGVYTALEHGVTLEAVKFTSTVTDENNSWVGQTVAYSNSYSNPVVLGQVMTDNDPDWSVFWASNGTRTNPPSATNLAIGKHVAEDTDITRVNETIGYVVIEAGSGSLGNYDYQAGVGSDIVKGVVDSGAPYAYPVNMNADNAVVSSAGMDGGNGGWPVLLGPSPFQSSQILLGIDEDQINDTERNRTTDQAAYLTIKVRQ